MLSSLEQPGHIKLAPRWASCCILRQPFQGTIKNYGENMQVLAFSAVMLDSSVMFISLAATLRKHIITSELCRKWFSPARRSGQRRAVNQRVEGEHLCCFEVSNDRQMAVRVNGRGQLGTAGATQPDNGATAPRATARRRKAIRSPGQTKAKWCLSGSACFLFFFFCNVYCSETSERICTGEAEVKKRPTRQTPKKHTFKPKFSADSPLSGF